MARVRVSVRAEVALRLSLRALPLSPLANLLSLSLGLGPHRHRLYYPCSNPNLNQARSYAHGA